MASYREILEVMAPETERMSASKIAEKLGQKVSQINTSLTRMTEKTWIDRDGDGNYGMTDAGRKELYPVTEESEQTTEYQQFITFGQRIGVKADLVALTAEHVWRGGNYTNLTWVWKAMMEQGVRSDMAKRWWHNWRSYLHQAVPPDLEQELGFGPASKAGDESAGGEEKAGAAAAAGKPGMRDYILGPDDAPISVGEGVGDYDYADAIAISKLKLAAKARAAAAGGGSAGPTSAADLITTIAGAVKAFNEATGGNGKNAPLVITQGENGVEIKEVKPGEPLVLGGGGSGRKEVIRWVVGPDGTARQLEDGEPVVITRSPPPGAGGGDGAGRVVYVHDDGSMEEGRPGFPVVIKERANAGANPLMINAQTPDGRPFVIDIDSYFKLEDHKDKRRREEESHEMKMEALKGVKDFIAKGTRALGGEE